MGEFTGSIAVNGSGEALFRYLSDVSNLTDYIPRLTSAEPGPGDEVKTTANLPEGGVVSADGWFRVNEDARRIEWGSGEPSYYSGHLHVIESQDGPRVEVQLHTSRATDGDPDVQNEIDEALRNIQRLAQHHGAGS
ncbi:MAG TPA: SRPBCC family protein [Mycobacterium sp.]|jgi:hypothetical protein|uniref:SRPBCC family protein n=1 Tax=Mycobacterium sp. TaxID=1785 RepID=UPI002D6A0F4E|nr:SRPBCC family protein [Mycobacterium sp.]HZU49095.1 SRPBCC family protein [Mycobacterium sp.]